MFTPPQGEEGNVFELDDLVKRMSPTDSPVSRGSLGNLVHRSAVDKAVALSIEHRIY